jgi:membrane-associated phospholipid phosphatase
VTVFHRLLLAIAVAAGLAGPAHAKPRPSSQPVAGWIAVTLDEIAAHRLNPPHASRALATLSVAVERAVEPAQGRKAGAAAVDGADTPWLGTIPTGPEFWTPTPPGFVPPLLPGWGAVRTWNVQAPAALLPPAPPRPGSAAFARELREVYRVSQTLTARQREIALFWADGAGTFTPPGHWNAIAADLARAQRPPLRREALLFATLNTAQADAFICAWIAKYTYWSLRPVTAIRRRLDSAWAPLIATPPFPSYVSGHSTTSAAAATVLAAFFPRQARQLHAWAKEAAVSRLYGGIHFRSDNEAGLDVGTAAGNAALAAQRVRRR